MPVQMPKPPPSHGPGAAGIISAAATNAAAAAAAAAANTTEAAASGGAPRPPIDRLCTLYIARIPDGVSDETMLALLETCGRVKRWQRPTDPYTGRPRTYGFCDWALPASVLRARRVLPGAVKFVRPAGGGAIGEAEAAPLLLRVDSKMEDFLRTYDAEHKEYTKHVLRLQQAAAAAGAPAPANPVVSDDEGDAKAVE